MRFFRRAAPVLVEPLYTVQLHRLTRESGWSIANSWEPIEVRGLREARRQAHELRQCNRWGAADMCPHVTITDQDGNQVP